MLFRSIQLKIGKIGNIDCVPWFFLSVSLTEKMVFCIINLPGGAVAQLGEYVTGSHGVAGSSPVSSTIKFFFEQVPKSEVA